MMVNSFSCYHHRCRRFLGFEEDLEQLKKLPIFMP